jgi:hypothetical protein
MPLLRKGRETHYVRRVPRNHEKLTKKLVLCSFMKYGCATRRKKDYAVRLVFFEFFVVPG